MKLRLEILFSGLTLLLFMPFIIQQGMFMDGLWYATIGRNISMGIGSFWFPKFTNTIFPVFHEHPPLVFGIQSVFYDLFGYGLWVERFYCIVVFLLTVYLIAKLWQAAFKSNEALRNLYFIPLILWITVEDVYRMYPNNLLECTLAVFSTMAVLLLLNYQKNRKSIFIANVLAGLCIWLAMLCKGPVAMFPLAFWIIHCLSFRQFAFTKALYYSFQLLIATAVFAGITLLIWPEATDSLGTYLHQQVMAALDGNRSENIRGHHFHIMVQFIQHNILGIVTLALSTIFFRDEARKYLPWVLFFLLMGLSASLPLTVSLKQASYYLIPSLPFYHIAFTIVLAVVVSKKLSHLSKRSKLIYNAVFTAVLVGGIALCISQFGKYRNSKTEILLHDTRILSKLLPQEELIGGDFNKFEGELHGYLMRTVGISIDTIDMFGHQYIASDHDLKTKAFEQIEVPNDTLKMLWIGKKQKE